MLHMRRPQARHTLFHLILLGQRLESLPLRFGLAFKRPFFKRFDNCRRRIGLARRLPISSHIEFDAGTSQPLQSMLGRTNDEVKAVITLLIMLLYINKILGQVAPCAVKLVKTHNLAILLNGNNNSSKFNGMEMKPLSLPPAFANLSGLLASKITKKTAVGMLLALFAVMAMNLGYLFLQERQAVANVRPALDLCSAYVSDVLDFDRNPSDMSLTEYFRENEVALAEIEKKVAEIRGLAEVEHETVYYGTIKHLQLSKAIIREFSELYRRAMLIDAAEDKSKRARASLKNARGIQDANHRRRNFLESLNESVEALEATRRSRRKIVYLLMQMQSDQTALEKMVGTQHLVNSTALAKAVAKLSVANSVSEMPAQKAQ